MKSPGESPGAPHLVEMWGSPLLTTLVLLLSSLACAAQSKPSKPAMPTKPLALLQLGARSNGLNAPNLNPWHIKAAYQVYKPDGRLKDTGTFEEWWAAPNQYRLSFDRKDYHLQSWVTPRGSYHIGNPDLPMPERLVYHWLIAPFPRHPDLQGASFQYRALLIGPNQLPCVLIHPRKPTRHNLSPVYPQYCFEPNRPILRTIDTQVSEQVYIARVALLDNRYLAQRFSVSLDHRILRVQITQGQSFRTLPAALFTPPAHAKSGPPPATAILYLTAAESATHRMQGIPHANSAVNILRQNHAAAEFAATIDAHGRITSLHLLSTVDPSLIGPLYDAISMWTYWPFLLHGKPAPVRTRILLDFRKPLP